MTVTQEINYSDVATKRLHEAAEKAGGSIDWDLAKKLGVELGKKPKSIVAKLIREGIEYRKQPGYVAKTGSKPTPKKETVSNIEKVMGVEANSLKDIVSASKNSLEKLLGDLIVFGGECYKRGEEESQSDDTTESEEVEESDEGTESEQID